MNVLFYIPFKGNEKINRLVCRVSVLATTRIFQSAEDFSRRFSQPAYGSTVGVLIAGDREQLLNIISIRHLLSEIPIILVLPDREESTTTMGHTLAPRFLTYMDGKLAEVAAVLEKMAKKYNKKEVTKEWDNIWKM